MHNGPTEAPEFLPNDHLRLSLKGRLEYGIKAIDENQELGAVVRQMSQAIMEVRVHMLARDYCARVIAEPYKCSPQPSPSTPTTSPSASPLGA